MFDLLRRWPISMGWCSDKDESGSGGKPDDSAEDKSKKEDESKVSDDPDKAKAKKEEKTFTQAELDQKVEERIQHERRKAEKEADKIRKQAEESALEKNQEWQKLAETRATELATVAKERDDLAPYKEQAAKYKAALDAQLAKLKEKLPDYLQEVVDKMDPVEAMDYITKHGEKIGVKPSTYSETPEQKERKLNDDDKKAGESASAKVITRSF